jgi:hypothetical protein
MNTKGHYRVLQNDMQQYQITKRTIRALQCCHCTFSINPFNFRRPGRDRSGLPAYARARGIMVKHLHEKHSEKLQGSQ